MLLFVIPARKPAVEEGVRVRDPVEELIKKLSDGVVQASSAPKAESGAHAPGHGSTALASLHDASLQANSSPRDGARVVRLGPSPYGGIFHEGASLVAF